MGYIKHHTIVVTSWSEDKLKDVHAKALEIFKEEFSKDEAPAERDGSALVSPIIDGVTNMQQSFFIAPDGSKEGWVTSECGDNARRRIIEYINSIAFEDGSNSVDYVEVFFGEDNGRCEVVQHN